jgi:hypothetical protein
MEEHDKLLESIEVNKNVVMAIQRKCAENGVELTPKEVEKILKTMLIIRK